MIKPNLYEKPWGNEVEYVLNSTVTVKILRILPGQETSLQKHKLRSEYWRVLSGKGHIICGNETLEVGHGLEINIEKEQIHRISATSETIEILEISSGFFDANDIVRIEDKYGRK